MNSRIKYLKYLKKNSIIGGVNFNNEEPFTNKRYNNICVLCRQKYENTSTNRNINSEIFALNIKNNYNAYIKYFENPGLVNTHVQLSTYFPGKINNKQNNSNLNNYIKEILSDEYFTNCVFLCPVYHCICCRNPLDMQISLTGSIEEVDIVENNIKQTIYNCINRELKEEIGLYLPPYEEGMFFGRKNGNIHLCFLNLDNCLHNFNETYSSITNRLPNCCKKIYYQNSPVATNPDEVENQDIAENPDVQPNSMSGGVNEKVNVILYFSNYNNPNLQKFIYKPQYRDTNLNENEYYDLLSVGIISQPEYLNILDFILIKS
jgi:hypothetical protein